MTDLEVVEKTIKLFQNPRKWTKGSLARNSSNYEVSPLDKSATSWCILGGLIKSANNTVQAVLISLKIRDCCNIMGMPQDLERANDCETLDRLLQLLKIYKESLID